MTRADYIAVVKGCPKLVSIERRLVDTWWQTATGVIMASALPGVTARKLGSAMGRIAEH
jgi:acyl-coenzyme A synthetase/AMP-(fatty) acid ligase